MKPGPKLDWSVPRILFWFVCFPIGAIVVAIYVAVDKTFRFLIR